MTSALLPSPRAAKLVLGGLEKGEESFKVGLENQTHVSKGPQQLSPKHKVIPSTPNPQADSSSDEPSAETSSSSKAELPTVCSRGSTSNDVTVERDATSKHVQFSTEAPAVFSCPMDRHSQKARRRSTAIEHNLANFDRIERELAHIDEEVQKEELRERRRRRNPFHSIKEFLNRTALIKG